MMRFGDCNAFEASPAQAPGLQGPESARRDVKRRRASPDFLGVGVPRWGERYRRKIEKENSLFSQAPVLDA